MSAPAPDNYDMPPELPLPSNQALHNHDMTQAHHPNLDILDYDSDESDDSDESIDSQATVDYSDHGNHFFHAGSRGIFPTPDDYSTFYKCFGHVPDEYMFMLDAPPFIPSICHSRARIDWVRVRETSTVFIVASLTLTEFQAKLDDPSLEPSTDEEYAWVQDPYDYYVIEGDLYQRFVHDGACYLVFPYNKSCLVAAVIHANSHKEGSVPMDATAVAYYASIRYECIKWFNIPEIEPVIKWCRLCYPELEGQFEYDEYDEDYEDYEEDADNPIEDATATGVKLDHDIDKDIETAAQTLEAKRLEIKLKRMEEKKLDLGLKILKIKKKQILKNKKLDNLEVGIKKLDSDAEMERAELDKLHDEIAE